MKVKREIIECKMLSSVTDGKIGRGGNTEGVIKTKDL